MSLRSILVRLIGAYDPDELARRKAHTDSVVRRAGESRMRADANSRKVVAVIESYRQTDERLRR